MERMVKKKWIPVLGRKFVAFHFFWKMAPAACSFDPQGASMDVHRNFSDEVSASALLSPNWYRSVCGTFLRRAGSCLRKKIKLDERIIPQGFPLFVFGTLGENKTMNASIPRPQICGASPLSYSFHPGGGTLMFRMSSKRATECRQSTRVRKCAWPRSGSSRGNARHPDGTPVDAFSQGTKRASAPPCLLPQQFFRSSRQLRRRLPALHQTQQKSVEFDLHPSVCIGKGERNELFTISARSQRESRRQTGRGNRRRAFGRTSTGAHLLLLSEDLFRVASVSISALIVLFAVSGAIFYLGDDLQRAGHDAE